MEINLLKNLLDEVKDDTVKAEIAASSYDVTVKLTDPMVDFNPDQETQLMNDLILSHQAVQALRSLMKAETDLEQIDFDDLISVSAFQSALSFSTFGVYSEVKDEEKPDNKGRIKEMIKSAVKAVAAILQTLNKRFLKWMRGMLDLSRKRQQAVKVQLDRLNKRKWKLPKRPEDRLLTMDGYSRALTNIKSMEVIEPGTILDFSSVVESIDFTKMTDVFVKEMTKGIEDKDGSTNVVRGMLSSAIGAVKFDTSDDVSFIALHGSIGLRLVVKGVQGDGKMNFSLMYPPSMPQKYLQVPVPERETIIMYLDTAYVLFGKTLEIEGNDVEAEVNTLLRKAEKEEVPKEVLLDLSTEATNYIALNFGLNKFLSALGLALYDVGRKSINIAT